MYFIIDIRLIQKLMYLYYYLPIINFNFKTIILIKENKHNYNLNSDFIKTDTVK